MHYAQIDAPPTFTGPKLRGGVKLGYSVGLGAYKEGWLGPEGVFLHFSIVFPLLKSTLG